MSKHGTSPEFERKLQDLAARTAHMIIPRSNVERPWSEMAFPDAPPESEPRQVIPEAAVEAAISAMLRTTPNLYRLSADVLARAGLEAAAPHMVRDAKADAWDEGIEAGVDVRTRKLDYARNPYRPAK